MAHNAVGVALARLEAAKHAAVAADHEKLAAHEAEQARVAQQRTEPTEGSAQPAPHAAPRPASATAGTHSWVPTAKWPAAPPVAQGEGEAGGTAAPVITAPQEEAADAKHGTPEHQPAPARRSWGSGGQGDAPKRPRIAREQQPCVSSEEEAAGAKHGTPGPCTLR